MLGYTNSATTTAATKYDRQLFFNNAGNVVFGTQPNAGIAAAVSPLSYTDGLWHLAVGTQSAAGMVLYVDGVSVATNTATTGRAFTGFWRIGQGNLNGWAPNQPTSNQFLGTLDEVAVYPTALTAANIASMWTASGR